MTEQEKIEKLKLLYSYYAQFNNEDITESLSWAIQALQQTRWIPVTERLPEWDIECLVVDDKGEFGVGFYRDDVGAWDSPSWGWLERKDDVNNHDAYYMPCGIGKVIAWMPLPKPYELQERSDKEDENK